MDCLKDQAKYLISALKIDIIITDSNHSPLLKDMSSDSLEFVYFMSVDILDEKIEIWSAGEILVIIYLYTYLFI